MICPHCHEELTEVYIRKVLFHNYKVYDDHDDPEGVFARWTDTDESVFVDGPYCRSCGGAVDIPTID